MSNRLRWSVQRTEGIRLALVGGLLILVACSGEGPSPSAQASKPVPIARQAPTPARPAAAAPVPPAPIEPERARYSGVGRRDPFLPLVKTEAKGAAASEVGQLTLAGIVWQEGGYYALLESPDGLGHVLRVNDRVGKGARVTNITKDTVFIEVKNRDVLGRSQTQIIKLQLKKEGE